MSGRSSTPALHQVTPFTPGDRGPDARSGASGRRRRLITGPDRIWLASLSNRERWMPTADSYGPRRARRARRTLGLQLRSDLARRVPSATMRSARTCSPTPLRRSAAISGSASRAAAMSAGASGSSSGSMATSPARSPSCRTASRWLPGVRRLSAALRAGPPSRRGAGLSSHPSRRTVAARLASSLPPVLIQAGSGRTARRRAPGRQRLG